MIVLSDLVKLKIHMLARNMNRVFFIQKETTDVQSFSPNFSWKIYLDFYLANERVRVV